MKLKNSRQKISLSASGARIRGDEYQHLVTWCLVLQILLDHRNVRDIGIEDPDAGNMDDITVYYQNGSGRFYQVKFSVDARQLVNTAWLMRPSKNKRPSIIQRFYKVWKTLRQNGITPHLELITNRPIDPEDPILILRDGRGGSVAERLSNVGSGTLAGKQKLTMAQHLDASESELIDFLHALRFTFGKLQEEWFEKASLLMRILGYRWDNDAIAAGKNLVRSWVIDGKRKFASDELRREVESLNLQAGKPIPMLLVQAIDRDPNASGATILLDWVDNFYGDEPRERRRLKKTALWHKKFRPELQDAVRKFRAMGASQIFVRGYMRLPTWFVVGVELSKTSGFNIMTLQNGEPFSTEGKPDDFLISTKMNKRVAKGSELAIGISISTDLSADVLPYIERNIPVVGRYICVRPQKDPDNFCIESAAQARGCALNIREKVRQLVRKFKPDKLHLFLATPAAVALILGHYWDRLPDTQLYEDQGPNRGYLPSFFIPN